MKDHKKAAADSNYTRLYIVELSFQQLRTIFDQSGKLIWSVKVNNPFPASGRKKKERDKKKEKEKKSCLSKMVHPRHLFSFSLFSFPTGYTFSFNSASSMPGRSRSASQVARVLIARPLSIDTLLDFLRVSSLFYIFGLFSVSYSPLLFFSPAKNSRTSSKFQVP
jgi:hypothetical protein